MSNNQKGTDTITNTSNVTTMGNKLRLSKMKRFTIVINVTIRCASNVDLTFFLPIRIRV